MITRDDQLDELIAAEKTAFNVCTTLRSTARGGAKKVANAEKAWHKSLKARDARLREVFNLGVEDKIGTSLREYLNATSKVGAPRRRKRGTV